MKDLQRAGGISALIAAATYIFAILLAFTILAPMTDTALEFDEYISFLSSNETLVFAWHSVMYLVNGICLVVIALALRERIRDAAPHIADISAVFGIIWSAFVILSGLITNTGLTVLLGLSRTAPEQAAALKLILETQFCTSENCYC